MCKIINTGKGENMKYDLENKTNRFATRTLATFSNTLFQLLSKKNFETIMVNEICEISNYPRATFYNYFDDKYDLLEYCWSILRKKIRLDEYPNIEPEKRTYEIFDRIYDFLNINRNNLSSILHLNTLNGELITNFRIYTKSQISNIMEHCSCTERYTIPYGIIAEHYCNTIMLVLEWSFLQNKQLTKKEAHEYLTYLLSNI